jgi:hypothetical protein
MIRWDKTRLGAHLYGRLILWCLCRLVLRRRLILGREVDTTDSTHDFPGEQAAFPFGLKNTNVFSELTWLHTAHTTRSRVKMNLSKTLVSGA